MISDPDFDLINKRFREYLNSIGTHDHFIQEHIDLKVEHTYRVVGNIFLIARNSGLPDDDAALARIVALVHDIGRFQQFITYHTFDDSQSVNHAELGITILKETGLLNELDEPGRLLVYSAIMNHNVAKLDPGLPERVLHFARLIRDADKVDIWYILTLRDVVNKILTDHLPETSYRVPDQIVDCYRKGRTVPSAVSMNDYRLLRLSWIFDMNFPATFGLVLKRDYIAKILAKVPSSAEKNEIEGIIYRFVHEKAGTHHGASLKI